MNEGLKVKLHGALRWEGNRQKKEREQLSELHPSIECRCLFICPMWSASVGRAAAAGALWMRAYFKGPGMLRFDFMRRGRWHQAAAKSFHEVCALLDGFRHAATACVPTQTWYLFEVCTPRGGKRKTDWVGCQWNEWGCHQATLLSDSSLSWLSTHTFSVSAELKLCSGSFVCMKSMSCSLSSVL